MRLITLVFCGLFVCSVMKADPIVVTETTTGSGQIGNRTFSNASIVFSVRGDSAAVLNNGNYSSLIGPVVTTIEGVGSFVSPDFGGAVICQRECIGLFPQYASGGISLTDRRSFVNGFTVATYNDVFASFNFATNLGPIATAPGTENSSFYPASYLTDGGVLTFSSYGPGVFQSSLVSVTPEPSGLVLLGSGLLGLIGVARRHFR